MADRPPPDPRRSPGVLQALLVGLALVGVVALAVVVTQLLPDELEQAVYRTPIAIWFLIVGTALVLWRVSRRERT